MVVSLRVKTRICGLENFTYNKFPTLLKNDGYFTKLIVLKSCTKSHSGVDSTLKKLKKKLKNCFICKFVHSKTMVPPETPALPTFQVQCSHSFENVRVDFADPLYCKEKPGDMSKVCILLFTCCVTQAVHLGITFKSSTTFVNISYSAIYFWKRSL